MFTRSAAMDTLQGKAIHSINMKWGSITNNDISASSSSAPNARMCGRAPGRETIGIPVCKKKYKPFEFRVLKQTNTGSSGDGTYTVQVERLYGCQCHHPYRKQVIEQHGERPGWQTYGVWSLRKAQHQARIEAARLNGEYLATDTSSTTTNDTVEDSGDEDVASAGANGMLGVFHKSLSNICLNGACTWKVESAYDNIYKEIHGYTESEAEDNG
jgi:hypothetical protein